jgi:iron complex outermembrane recepter protein
MSRHTPSIERKPHTRRVLCVCTALVVGAPLIANAQQAPEATKAPAADTGGLEEVVVTAQRREQKLQDIGISVTALNNETLADLNITNATDITRAVPALKMNAYSSSQAVYNIRGVAQNSYGDEQEPPVAVYQDDSYSSSINLASFPVFDLARVEVLRGPQGTLFGRNADGGAIQFISRKPTKDFEGYVTATFGTFGQQIYEGALSGPLADNWQGRFAFISNTDNGYIKEWSPGQQDRGANHNYALRGQISWQPTDSINANLILRYLRADHERQAGLYSHEPACPNAQHQGEFLGAGVYCSFWGVTGTTGTGFVNPKMIPSRGGTPWATEETSTSFVDRNIKSATLRLDVKVASVDLVSISDFQKGNKFYIEGGDASPDLGVVFYQGSDITQYSEEVRASSTVGANQIVGGLYGMKVEGSYTGQFADPFYADLYGGPQYAYVPYITARQDTTSFAVFAQDEWKATDRVSLIAGLRYWRDQRNGAYYGDEGSNGIHIAFDQNQVTGTSFGVPFDQSVVPITLTPADAKETFDDVTARLELDFRVNPDVLLYASYNRGSKSGGFSFSTGTPFADFPPSVPLGTDAQFLNGIPFKPEVLDAYEAGFKSTINNRTTFDVSAFYYDYHDYQAFVQLGVNQTVINLPANAYGVEAELNSHPVNGLTLQIGISGLSSSVKDIVLPDTVTHVEHPLPQAPDVSGNALARYEFPVANGFLSLQADVQYTDKFCFTVLCAPVEREAAYTVTNARIGYGPANKRWDISAFVNNLTDAEYRVYAFDSSLFAGVVAGVYAKPRTYGITGTYRFGAGY